MGLLRYSEHEFRELARRVVPVRWPNERMLLVTGCHGERIPVGVKAMDSAGRDRADARGGHALQGPRLDGFLAATESRLIFQERTSSTALIKTTVAVTGVLAIVALFSGNGVVDFLAMAGAAVVLWFVARVVEHFSVGNVNIEFGRIASVDSSAQQIDGVAHTGSLYRLHIPNPSHFDIIRALAEAA